MQTQIDTDIKDVELSFSLFTWRVWISAAIGAILLNIVLFLLLPLLIHPSPPDTDISERIDHVQVIRLRNEKPPVHKKKEKPPEPVKQEPKPKEKVSPRKSVPVAKLSIPLELNSRLPSISTDIAIPVSKTMNIGGSIKGAIGVQDLDAPLTPISRIPPVYPLRARRKGLEGWVRVTFEIDTSGYVENLQILEAEPPGIFDKSVIKCVSRWRYKPGTVESVPVRTTMETTVRFEME